MLMLMMVAAFVATANETVPGTPVITNQPQNMIVRAGAHNVFISASITGGGLLGWVWQQVLGEDDFHTFPHANNSFPITVTTDWQPTTFRAIIYNAADRELPLTERRQVISNEFTVTRATGIPVLTWVTESQTLRAGTHVNLGYSATVAGYGAGNFVTGQVWQELVNDNWIDVGTARNFRVDVHNNMTRRTFRVIVFNSADNNLPREQRRQVVSEPIEISRDLSRPVLRGVQATATAGSNAATSVLVGDVITLTADAVIENGDPIRYQWYLRFGADTVFYPIEGATQAILNFPVEQRANHAFFVIVYNGNDSELPMTQRRMAQSGNFFYRSQYPPNLFQRLLPALLPIGGVALLILIIYGIWWFFNNFVLVIVF